MSQAGTANRSPLRLFNLRERIRDRDAAVYGILLRGDYLAIVTLGFGEIVPQLFYNFDRWTGGINAIGLIDQPHLPVWLQGPWSGDGPFAFVTNFNFNTDPVAYYVLIVILITLAV